MSRARIKLLTFAVTVALLTLAAGRPAYAATKTVTTLADSGPGSLRQAIADAAPGDTIEFAVEGLIRLTSGELVVDKNLTIVGPGPARGGISGESMFRVLSVAPGAVAEIRALTIENGQVGFGVRGGGILVDHATLTLRDAILLGNQADTGSGIYSNGTLTVVNTEFSFNGQSGAQGAGIYSIGALTVTDSRFFNNDAAYGFGGAVHVESGTARIIRSRFQNNRADTGGAVYVSSGQATVLDSTFADNRVGKGSGGAIHNHGAVAIVHSTLSHNLTDYDRGEGAGVYSLGSLTMVDSTVSGNQAQNGGVGGGVVIAGGTANIADSTIVLNTGSGGVVQTAGTVVLANTIVAGNTDTDIVGTVGTADNNLIGGNLASIVDPTLADNGGPTMTHALVANGPAIDAGDNAKLPADSLDLDGDGNTTEPIPFDQRGRGFPRVLNGIVDIGAIELGCVPISIAPLPNGSAGFSYSQQLNASGGQGPYTFAAATLPPGLALSSDGVLSGTPSTVGTFTFDVTVTEERGCIRTVTVTLTVVEDTGCGITIGPATLPTPYIATLYYRALSTSMSAQYSWTVSAGALPTGLYLVPIGSTTYLAGFATTPGTYTFTIKAQKKNTACAPTRTYSVTIPPTVAPQLTCLVKSGNKQYTARFGYDNTTGAPVTIPVGANNYFTPGAQNRGQITVFQPGQVTNAFSVTFTVSGNKSDLAIWFLKGPDGVTRPVNITTATFPCQ
jgi:hypothetical protein